MLAIFLTGSIFSNQIFRRPYRASLIVTIFMVFVCSGDLINCTECSGITAVRQAGVH